MSNLRPDPLPGIPPESIVGTMLVIHLILGITVWVGALILHSAEDKVRSLSFTRLNEGPPLHGTTIFFFFAALASVVFSEEFVTIWIVMFPDLAIPGMNSDVSRSLFFLLELCWAGVIIAKTGGGVSSPFSPIIAGIPAIAVFLHEPPTRFLAYAFISAIVFAGTIYSRIEPSVAEKTQRYKHSIMFVMLMMLATSTLTAYVTRPR